MIKKDIAINRGTLMRIWRQFKAEPTRVFILDDFKGGSYVHRGYLELLLGLGLVLEVPVKYNGFAHRDVKGYKLYPYTFRTKVKKKEPVIFSKLKADSVSFDKKAKEEELAVIFSKLKNNNLKR